MEGCRESLIRLSVGNWGLYIFSCCKHSKVSPDLVVDLYGVFQWPMAHEGLDSCCWFTVPLVLRKEEQDRWKDMKKYRAKGN